MSRTIVVVGMIMFKLKELVKVQDKSEIWSEDIKAIRHTFDEEHKKKSSTNKREISNSNLSNFGTTKTIPTETVIKQRRMKSRYASITLILNLATLIDHITYEL